MYIKFCVTDPDITANNKKKAAAVKWQETKAKESAPKPRGTKTKNEEAGNSYDENLKDPQAGKRKLKLFWFASVLF